jgi:hypothetical protein
MHKIDGKLSPKGRVEIFTTKGVPSLVFGERVSTRKDLPPHYLSVDIDMSSVELISKEDVMNIVVNAGKDTVIRALASGASDVVARMAIGDRGTLPSDSTVPKTPVVTSSSLYHEIRREDVDAVVVDVGSENKHEVKFIKTFSSVDIPITAYSNQASPVVNEIALITVDPEAQSFPRSPVNAPAAAPSDEKMFSIRTFKSVPFDAANEIAITIRYTIFID